MASSRIGRGLFAILLAFAVCLAEGKRTISRTTEESHDHGAAGASVGSQTDGEGLGQGDPDYYKILGVASSATTAEIKKAYRKLAMKWHPDKNNNDAEATLKFQEIAQAFNVLGEVATRSEYDRQRRDGPVKPSSQPSSPSKPSGPGYAGRPTGNAGQTGYGNNAHHWRPAGNTGKTGNSYAGTNSRPTGNAGRTGYGNDADPYWRPTGNTGKTGRPRGNTGKTGWQSGHNHNQWTSSPVPTCDTSVSWYDNGYCNCRGEMACFKGGSKHPGCQSGNVFSGRYRATCKDCQCKPVDQKRCGEQKQYCGKGAECTGSGPWFKTCTCLKDHFRDPLNTQDLDVFSCHSHRCCYNTDASRYRWFALEQLSTNWWGKRICPVYNGEKWTHSRIESACGPLPQ